MDAGWWPIETAPRNETLVLLAFDGYVSIGFWNGHSWDDGDYYDNMGNPTHWMPLPPLPASEDKQ